jgi:hypothetical protein
MSGTEDVEGPEILKRRRAAVVLEVLGGAKSPSEAAEDLGIALPSYYVLEARALEGLVDACLPRARGRGPGRAQGSSALQRENERLRRELARSQALHRAVQRAAGVPVKDAEKGGGRKRRRPHARALRAAKSLSVGKDSLPTSPLGVGSPVS